MKKRICFMYTGQGSQYYGMAKKLYENNEVFRDRMNYLDKVVNDVGGYSVIEELYFSHKTINDPFQTLELTHPAIFMVEYSLTSMLLSEGIKPDFLIGSSLGELVSLTVAGCETPEKMLEFVIQQAFLFKARCASGGMLTILDDYEDYVNSSILGNDAEIVSVNYNKHFVVSGNEAGMNRIEDALKKNGVYYFKLPVEFGFHSKNIDTIYSDFIGLTTKLSSRKANISVYSSSKAGLVSEFTGQALWEAVRKGIRFNQTLKKMVDSEDMFLIDVGPSGTLASLSKVILNKKHDIESIITPFHTEEKNIEKIKNLLEI